MFDDYTVIGAGHINAGKELTIGETLRLRIAQAERYPASFQRKRATPTKAERPARATPSAKPSAPAPAERSNASTDTEE